MQQHVLHGAPDQDLRKLQPAPGLREAAGAQVFRGAQVPKELRQVREEARSVPGQDGQGALPRLQAAEGFGFELGLPVGGDVPTTGSI